MFVCVAHYTDLSKINAGVNYHVHWYAVQAYTSSSVTLLNVSITRRIQFLAVSRSFRYSAFPVIGYYTTFSILDISSERHYLHFYSNIPLPDVSITRRFSSPICSNSRSQGLLLEVLRYLYVDVRRSHCGAVVNASDFHTGNSSWFCLRFNPSRWWVILRRYLKKIVPRCRWTHLNPWMDGDCI